MWPPTTATPASAHAARAAGEDRVEDLERQLVVGEEHEVEREPRLAAHRPHVRERVRRGDRAERVRIVDERRDHVGGEHEVAAARRVCTIAASSEIRVIDDDVRTHPSRSPFVEVIEDVCQLTEPELGGSTTAARVLRQTDGGLGFGRHGAQRSTVSCS